MINPEVKYLRNVDIITSSLTEETVMMNVLNGMYFSINEVGSRIWEILEKPHDLNAVVNMLLDEYEISEEECKEEVTSFFNEMIDNALIAPDPKSD